MPILGTGVSDPDFYERKLALARQSLATIAEGHRRRQAEKEQRELQEIQTFTNAVRAMPELANTWGQELKRKYGDRYGIGPTVDVLQRRQQIAGDVESAGREFYDTWDKLAKDYQAKQGEINSQPDVVHGIWGSAYPNTTKFKAQQELGKIDPNRMPQIAASKLPPSRRAAALLWAKQNMGQEIPDPATVDMFKVLPQDQQAFYALDQFPGMDPGNEIRDSLLYKTELKQSPQKFQEQGFSQGESEKTRTAQEGRIKLSDKLAREREEISDTHARERITLNSESQKGVISYRRSLYPPRAAGGGRGEKDSKLTHKAVLHDNDAEISDWEANLRHVAGDGKSKEAAKVKEEYARAHPRPVRLSDSEARALTTAINGAKIEGGDPNLIADTAISAYQEARQGGKTGIEALRIAKEALTRPMEVRVSAIATPQNVGTVEGRVGGEAAPVHPPAPSRPATPAPTPARPALKTNAEVEGVIRDEVSKHPGLDIEATVGKMMGAYAAKVASGMNPSKALQAVMRGE